MYGVISVDESWWLLCCAIDVIVYQLLIRKELQDSAKLLLLECRKLISGRAPLLRQWNLCAHILKQYIFPLIAGAEMGELWLPSSFSTDSRKSSNLESLLIRVLWLFCLQIADFVVIFIQFHSFLYISAALPLINLCISNAYFSGYAFVDYEDRRDAEVCINLILCLNKYIH